MRLKQIQGSQDVAQILDRVDPLDLSSLPDSVLERTRQVFGPGVTPVQSVVTILEDVRRDGDAAVCRYVRALDGFDLDTALVDPEQVADAASQVSPDVRRALELAAQRVADFHQSVMPRDFMDEAQGLGQLIRPIDRVGLYAPGGAAAYPSTVLMTAIPARVAGVSEIILTTPRKAGQPLNPAVMAAAQIAGVDSVYQVGGVPAIAAMAYGTESIPKVDKICGPGNIFVAYAKQLVQAVVGTDGIFGPTETIVIADDSADPAYCAADLIGQAEHDPLATAILITDSTSLVQQIEAELDRQIASLPSAGVALEALQRQGLVIIVDDIDQAVDLADRIAPEHLCLMLQDPWPWAQRVKHAGGLFLGMYSPEVMGDYIAGPSHVMPTGGTARFSSALGVNQFLRTMPVVGLSPDDFRRLGPAAVHIAEIEGLSAHAGAVQVRLDRLDSPAGK